MSYCSASGEQLRPDDLRTTPNVAADDSEVPLTVDAETGVPVVVVRFGDSQTVATPNDMCATMGTDLEHFHDAMAGLVYAGWLTLLEDGTYNATIPDEAHQ